MFDLIVLTTGSVIVAGAIIVYLRYKDALHPAVILAPVIGYVYAAWPLVLNLNGDVARLYPPGDLEYVVGLYLLSIASLYLGLCGGSGRPIVLYAGLQATRNWYSLEMTLVERKRVLVVAFFLGAFALAAYVHMIGNAGGFISAYSRFKGGGWASSGYIGEAILLSFPAILLLALSRQGQGSIRAVDVFFAVLIAMPHLLQGTFGGRRGPLFIVLSVLFMAWFIARGKRPSLAKIVLGLCIIGFSVIVVQSQRKHVFLGSEGQFDVSRVVSTIDQRKRIETNDYITGVSTVLTVDQFADFYWGRRYFIIIFIRPIPKQLWPTKYEDTGATWLHRYDRLEGGGEFLQAVGFEPPRGSAPGFVADIFHEFSWGVLVVLYLFGRALRRLWEKHIIDGGVWTVIYGEAMVLGIYLPTQSFSAWFHRFIFMSVITMFVWRYWVHRQLPKSSKTPLVHAEILRPKR